MGRLIGASVIVPAHDAQATLSKTLERLRAQEAPFAYEVIVVDDGSRDATAEIAAAAGEPVRVVRKQSTGAGDARNRGVAESRARALAFCDADCFPAAGWLAAGVRALEHASLVQGKVLPEPGVRIGPFDRSLWITHEGGLWETANLFVTRELFDLVGGFGGSLAPLGERPFGEDVRFGWRAKRMGARSAFCAEALSHHAVFPQRAGAHVAERRRLRHFPLLVDAVPELREAFLYRRVFLSPRSAAFDVACGGVLAALALRRPWPLLAALPYARALRSSVRAHPQLMSEVAAAELAADLLGALALARGSFEARTAVL